MYKRKIAVTNNMRRKTKHDWRYRKSNNSWHKVSLWRDNMYLHVYFDEEAKKWYYVIDTDNGEFLRDSILSLKSLPVFDYADYAMANADSDSFVLLYPNDNEYDDDCW